MIYCFDCRTELTAQEIEDHEIRCERCDTKLYERILSWRNGAKDAELEKILNDSGGTIH